MSSSPKSSAKLIGVTVAGMPILTPTSHFASNITETISALPEKREQFIQIEEINILIKFTFYCLQNSHDFFLVFIVLFFKWHCSTGLEIMVGQHNR